MIRTALEANLAIIFCYFLPCLSFSFIDVHVALLHEVPL